MAKRIVGLGMAAALLVLSGLATTANATLVTPRLGGQAVYDSDLDITWLADANLAVSNTFGLSTGANLGTHSSDTSGVQGKIFSDGSMNWPGALFWIDAMNATGGGTGYLGFNDWRLPATLFPDSGCTGSGNSAGWDCTGSEMGHLFYTEFGATRQTNVSATGNATELAKFSNVQPLWYWSGLEFNQTNAWFFLFNGGAQSTDIKSKGNGFFFAWAVRSGDVAALVPEPGTLVLMSLGLAGIGFSKRRKRQL